MLVGGGYAGMDTVELISLDPENNPVPQCLRHLKPFPKVISFASGATLEKG